MIRPILAERVKLALDELMASGALPRIELPAIEIIDTKSPEHGDYACNIAMTASKLFGKPPLETACLIRDHLVRPGAESTVQVGMSYLQDDPELRSIAVAAPGFLNLRVPTTFFVYGWERMRASVRSGRFVYPHIQTKSINVEFVSVNPNGPITIGSGRGAAFGSTLCQVLRAVGHDVHREYYVNDGVSSEQMRLFGESVRAICLGQPVPDNGYKGDYVHDVAHKIRARIAVDRYGYLPQGGLTPERAQEMAEQVLTDGRLKSGEVRLLHQESGKRLEERIKLQRRILDAGPTSDESEIRQRAASLSLDEYRLLSQHEMLVEQMSAMWAFGVDFDTWFYEQKLHDEGRVAEAMQSLVDKGVADDQPYRTTLKLAKGGVISEVLREEQAVDEDDADGQEPTLWLRSTRFGDDMDRVLRRRDGRPTYVASDLSYHADKLTRPENADQMITVLGPDHHGYIGRLTAVVASYFLDTSSSPYGVGGGGSRSETEGVSGSTANPLRPGAAGTPPPLASRQGEELSDIDAQLYASPEDKAACQAALATAKEKLQVVIFQIVRFMKDGKPAPMRKRDGNIYALIDLINEIGLAALPDAPTEKQQELGRDVARFFYLMRSHETAMDFDLDLAAKQSDENPVFYVQYAHARICSIIDKAKSLGLQSAGLTAFAHELKDEREHALLKRILDLPYEIERAATDYGVHRLATYATELARAFHYFYDGCRVIQVEEPDLTQARLALCEATKLTLARVFALLGISAPESM